MTRMPRNDVTSIGSIRLAKYRLRRERRIADFEPSAEYMKRLKSQMAPVRPLPLYGGFYRFD